MFHYRRRTHRAYRRCAVSWIVTGVIVLGAAAETYGNHMEGKAKQRAANAQARAKQRQAREILRRTDLELDQLTLETDDFVASQAGAFAAGNVDVGASVSLIAFEDTAQKAMSERLLSLEEARWQAKELELGADSDISSGRDARKVATIKSVGTVVNAAGSIYKGSKK